MDPLKIHWFDTEKIPHPDRQAFWQDIADKGYKFAMSNLSMKLDQRKLEVRNPSTNWLPAGGEND